MQRMHAMILGLAAAALFPAACQHVPPAGGDAAATGDRPAELALHTFRKIPLDERFYAEGSNIGDLNRDGVLDVVAGPFWYQGPHFRTRHQYYQPREFDPEKYSDNFFAHVHDLDGDGWQDILIIGFPGRDARWYRNPGPAGGHWSRHVVFEGVDNESPAWTDLTGDGKPEIVAISDGRYGYVQVDWQDPTRPWSFHPVTTQEGWKVFTHGLGIGDVNGDGRLDLIERGGWWEQPDTLRAGVPWRRHPADFGEGGAQMYAYDVDGDGDNDVITSLKAHGYGLAWFEQVEQGGGSEWVRHVIMNQSPDQNDYGIAFSQLHALDLVDVDGDGVRDIVTGKRFWAHGSTGDSDPGSPPVLYWFRTVRQGGGARFVPYLIDGDHGVGVQLVTGDLNGDALPDLVTSNKRGTAVLIHERRLVDRATWEAAQPRPVRAPASVAP